MNKISKYLLLLQAPSIIEIMSSSVEPFKALCEEEEETYEKSGKTRATDRSRYDSFCGERV
jgi:hypothetical protein